MNDCSAVIPPAPLLIRTAATAPIIRPQKARSHAGGVPSPVHAIAIVYAMESPPATSEITTSAMNAGTIIEASGYC